MTTTNLRAKLDRIPTIYFALAAFIWVCVFAVIYSLLPKELALQDSRQRPISGFGDTLYFSVVTATTLGDNQFAATGWLRILVSLEVIGGVVIAGLTVNSLVSIPSQQLRRAVNASSGWWLERVTFHPRPPYYNFTFIGLSGQELIKRGINFDPGGAMDGTSYKGTLLTEAFPILLCIYENSTGSPDYTDGITKFEMHPNGEERYLQYVGSCYDKLGKRDELFGKRILDDALVKRLDSGAITHREMRDAINRYFPKPKLSSAS